MTRKPIPRKQGKGKGRVLNSNPAMKYEKLVV